jgi:hypothetical protein
VEKELTTPQQYPLTITALVAACNQSSNRDPVVDYDEGGVIATLDELKAQRLVRFVLPSHGRSVVRYRHVLDETLGLDARQSAIVGMLLLRGAQTVGELRVRTERMADFDGLTGVEHDLELLAARTEPLAASVGRRPGQKEERWASTLVEPADEPSAAVRYDGAEVSLSDGARADDASGAASLSELVDGLRAEVAGLRSDVALLRSEFDELRASLGG